MKLRDAQDESRPERTKVLIWTYKQMSVLEGSAKRVKRDPAQIADTATETLAEADNNGSQQNAALNWRLH